MVVPEHREVRDRVQRVEVGAGEQEEVAHHALAVPITYEIGEHVEHVVSPPARLTDDSVNLRDELLEAEFGV